MTKDDIFAAIITMVAAAIIITNTIRTDFKPKPEPELKEETVEVQYEEADAEPPTFTATEIVPPEEEEPETVDITTLTKVRCTCYIPTGHATASGIMPYEGVCASNREHMGWTARIYTLDGELIGDFISLDTGGAQWLQNGTAIDIFRDNMDRVHEWTRTYGDYVLLEWIPPEEETTK